MAKLPTSHTIECCGVQRRPFIGGGTIEALPKERAVTAVITVTRSGVKSVNCPLLVRGGDEDGNCGAQNRLMTFGANRPRCPYLD